MIVIAGLVVLSAFAVWRLSQGPLPLDILRPYVERGFTTSDGSIRLVARQVTLNWAGWDRTLEVHVQTVEAINSEGQVLATVPDAAVKLSVLSLLTGEIAPTSIQMQKLRLHIVVDEKGGVNYSLDKQEENATGRIVGALFDQLLEGGGDSAIRKLNRVAIVGADIVFEDKQRNLLLRSPNSDLALFRDAEGVLIEASLELNSDGQRTPVNLRALYTRNRDRMAVALNFDALRPALFAKVDSRLSRLRDIDVPFSGTVDAILSGQGELRNVTFNVAGAAGTLNLADLIGQSRQVQSMALRGDLNLANGNLTLDEARIGLGSTTLSVTGKGQLSDAGLDMLANIAIDQFTGAELAQYWPPNLAPGGRRWALANISGGVARDVTLQVSVRGPLDGTTMPVVTLVQGGMKFSGLTVQYLTPMPPVEEVAGRGVFEPSRVVFYIDSGKLGDIALDTATVTITGLEAADQLAAIDASATGPFPALAKLLSHPKVGLPANAVIPPARAGGVVATRLLLQFPLIDKLTMKQLEFSASASTRGLSIKDVVPGVDLSDGTLTVQLNGQEMDVRGKAKVAGVASDVSWHENFARTAGFRRRYQIKTTIDSAEFARLGVSLSPYVAGAVGVSAIFQDNLAGGGAFDATLDLKQATLSLPDLKWNKPPGKDAGGRLSFEMQQGKLPPEFELQLATGDVEFKGRVAIANGLQRITFDRLISGRNDLSGSVVRTDTGYSVTLKGNRLDVAPLLADDAPSSAPAKPSGTILDVSIDVRRVLTKRGEIDAVNGKLRVQSGRLLNGTISARAPPDAVVQLQVTPAGAGRNITMTATDMGAVLKSLGWLEGMFGGQARLDGTFDDTKVNAPLRGRFTIDAYRLQKTPVVGDVLSVGALTDALSAFSGSGLEFNQLIVPFVWEDGVLSLRNARTAGSSLGITASGRIDTNSDTVQIAGVIVPAYMINSLIGNIPLLGPLITGGPGSGLFAINYAVEGPISKPRVSTNPLSVVAPGFLRGIFGAGSADDDTLEKSQPPRSPNEPQRN